MTEPTEGKHDGLLYDYAREAESMLVLAFADIHKLRYDNHDVQTKEQVSRTLHALKGGAAFFEQHDVVHLCHQAENYLEDIEKMPKDEVIMSLDDLLVTMALLLQRIDSVALRVDRFSGRREKKHTEFSEVLSMLPSMAKSVAHQLGKDVDVIILHDDIELNKKIVDSLLESLAHLVRNAVDHGIEHSSKRKILKKPAVGKIILDCHFKDNKLIIVIEDDGSGLDEEKIKKNVLKKKLISASALDVLDKESVWKLIFLPGFSTKDSVTEISGRGIGMDVVKTVVDELGGKIHLRSVPQRGTRITLMIPIKEDDHG